MAIRQASAAFPLLGALLLVSPLAFSLLAFSQLAFAPLAFAQPAEEGAGEGEGEEGDKAAGEEGEGGAGEGDDDDDDDDTKTPLGLDELCKIDPENCVQINMEEYAQRPVQAEMYAVQQIWALRALRFELNPYGAVTMNDQFVAHPGIGIEGNFYIINPLAIGVNFTWYGGLNSISDFNFETSRAARVGQPITEYQLNANLNLSYVFAYGKFAAFEDLIFHYDFFLKAGGGIISTRPIAVVDPDNRTFEYQITGTGNIGGGIRIFFTRWFAATLEVRDYIFPDRLENPAIATGFDAAGQPRAQDETTWLADKKEITNNVQAQLGLSFFLPPTWEYELPK